MSARRGRPPGPASEPAVAARVRHLLDLLFRGRQAAAAKELGLAQPYLSRVQRGVQAPGAKVLHSLLRQPRVNENWLLRGEGEPLIPSSAGTLPVAVEFVTTHPSSSPASFLGERQAVAAVLDRESRYFYRVPDSVHASLAQQLRIVPGDLLLIETDWTAIVSTGNVSRQLYVLSVQNEGRHLIALGVLTSVDSEVGEIRASVFLDRQESDVPFRPAAAQRLLRAASLTAAPQPRPRRRILSRLTDQQISSSVVAVVGVVLLLQRTTFVSAGAVAVQ